ncbi:hypothetical protein AA11826_0379 [Komagataeibacter oboediens DSM 11826]|uniref:hypothetical protein n=1 Tax=Komagataeibacter oboediens TaxID=65958 RepID=UPI001E454582|nr:hypothetical protein [Komagataeibacter oboediens]GBR28918.1 hypothetical protein AA11826_0379 [Komagataeibacter oboediens DSM 11826]
MKIGFTTGRVLPKGVWYRGPSPEDGERQTYPQNIRLNPLARRWLNEKRAGIDLGQFRDISAKAA